MCENEACLDGENNALQEGASGQVEQLPGLYITIWILNAAS